MFSYYSTTSVAEHTEGQPPQEKKKEKGKKKKDLDKREDEHVTDGRERYDEDDDEGYKRHL